MRKLNNKGITLIEMLICFVIVSAIVISMFNVIMNYQNEENTASVNSDIISYKNTITRMIQTDIIKGELKSVRYDSLVTNDNAADYKFTLFFNKSVNFSGKGSSILDKKLSVHIDKYNANYIIYDDVNSNGVKQTVQYDLPNVGNAYTNNTTKLEAITQFSNVTTNLKSDGSNFDSSTNTNLGINSLLFDIPIISRDSDATYHIKIVAPLNYNYSKVSD